MSNAPFPNPNPRVEKAEALSLLPMLVTVAPPWTMARARWPRRSGASGYRDLRPSAARRPSSLWTTAAA